MPLCHHIGLQNSCYVQDNITFNVSSILQMHDSKFLLYLTGAVIDVKYIARSKFSKSLVHKKNFSLI